MASNAKSPLWWNWSGWNAEVFADQMNESRILFSFHHRRGFLSVITSLMYLASSALAFSPTLVVSWSSVGLTTSSKSSMSLCSPQNRFTGGSLPSDLLLSLTAIQDCSHLTFNRSLNLSLLLRLKKREALELRIQNAAFVIVSFLLPVLHWDQKKLLLWLLHGLRIRFWRELQMYLE